jgi:hypothetical protein
MRALALLLATFAVCWPAPAQAGAARPALELASTDPLRIRGEHFRAYERVRLLAWVDGRKHVLLARAGRRGGFVVAIRTSVTPCNVTVRAVGERGSRAELAFDHVICPPTR